MGIGEVDSFNIHGREDWHCAHCGHRSGMYGHHMQVTDTTKPSCANAPIDAHGRAFCCPPHKCEPRAGTVDRQEHAVPPSASAALSSSNDWRINRLQVLAAQKRLDSVLPGAGSLFQSEALAFAEALEYAIATLLGSPASGSAKDQG